MRRRNKVLVWTGIILLLLVGAYYLVLPRILGGILSSEPRNPKLEISETSEIGWWAYQESLKVDSFTVQFVESKLNLFNNKSLIQYTVKGKLSHNGHWKPSIKNIHVSQRFLRQYNRELHPFHDSDTTKIPEAMIEITPVIEITDDDNYNGEEIEIEFTNELKLESFHWGNNWVRFQCGNKSQDLILKQRK
ncbi:hypothetical protein [Zhouia amylolytica]|uniref:hypothetical protein n=1 Tax=Zhouia amylolytica TaxID=376730 RepID=UPI0020CEEAD0|nr:hypothetical protein [Zhouia amylolytica]MCQ0113127.1 hypothetical protein [Zhouia amylolytica]